MRGKSAQDQLNTLLAAKAKLEREKHIIENKIDSLFECIKDLIYKHPELHPPEKT